MHDYGWKNGYFTSSDVAILGHGYGVSQYPQLYDKHLEKYQLLPHPYLGKFEVGNEEKRLKTMDVRLGRWIWNFCLWMYCSKYRK